MVLVLAAALLLFGAIQLRNMPVDALLGARQVVTERLTQSAGLHMVAKPPAMILPLSSTSRVMMVGLSSREFTPIEVSVLARWTIRPHLMGVPGVANGSIWGRASARSALGLSIQSCPGNCAFQYALAS